MRQWFLHEEAVSLTNHNLTLATIAMEEKKVKVEGAGKGGGRPFHHWNFKKKDSMFKSPTVGMETIVFSYGQPKDAAAFIK